MWQAPREPELAELAIADASESWRAVGFEVHEDNEDGHVDLGGVRIRLGAKGQGIVSWSLRRVNAMGSIDGLPTPVPRVLNPPPFKTHPNGATGLDHVVLMTPDFDRTAEALKRAGLPLKRTQDIGRGKQGFRRVGPAILELVHNPKLAGDEPEFWGLVIVVISLEQLAEQLGENLSEISSAVQPGRRIATLRPSAGLSPAIAFMSPEPP
jgi:hypothetical protein